MMFAIDKRDLRAEEAIVFVLQTHFQAQRHQASPVGDKTYDVKLWLPHGGELYCEIKVDRASAHTGNAFFEIRNTALDTSSGLVATRASVWAHYLPKQGILLLVDPKALLWWLATHMRTTPRFNIRLSDTQCGDENAQGYIVPLSVLLARQWIGQIPCTIPMD